MAVYQSTWMLKDRSPSLASQLPQELRCIRVFQPLLDEGDDTILQRLHASQRFNAIALRVQLGTPTLE